VRYENYNSAFKRVVHLSKSLNNLEIANKEFIKELSIKRFTYALNTNKMVYVVACNLISNKLNNFNFFILTTI
jgi:hypothetical protein